MTLDTIEAERHTNLYVRIAYDGGSAECDCTVCRAADGDQKALGEIYMAADYGGD